MMRIDGAKLVSEFIRTGQINFYEWMTSRFIFE
jgi:hypothetical protein